MTSSPSDNVSAFLASLAEVLGPDANFDRDALGIALEVFLADAHTAHPDLVGSEPALARYAASRLSGYRPAQEELAKLHAADLVLAKACAEGNTDALNVFERDFLGLVSSAGRKLSMSPNQCDELRQQVRMKLLVAGKEGSAAKIANYAGTGALRSWVYATALRTGLNELRRIGRAPIPAGDEQLLVAMPDSKDNQELLYMKQLYRSAFKDSFKGAIGQLEDRLANVLRHYYLDEMTLEDIGSLYRVHKTTAMRWLNKAHAELEFETKKRMISHLQLQPSEVESVMRLIQSGIQLGLASVLAIDKSES